MNASPSLPRYSNTEDIANSATHSLGIVLSISGLLVLIVFSIAFGNIWHIVGCAIYGVTQIMMYTASTLYHSIQKPRVKSILRILDHSAIFLLIAGTYTPFTLVNLHGTWGWSILIMVWVLAIIGIGLQSRLIKYGRLVTAIPYIAMGWIVIIAIKPLLESVAPGGILLLLGGGFAYTAGTIFYAWKRLPYHHAIWHGFVMMGSVLHFFAILLYVIPLAK
jgi:hemolysin III